jgi:plastocyanin
MRLDPQNRVIFNTTDGFGYSFWFYDNNTTSTAESNRGVWLQGIVGGSYPGVTFQPTAKRVSFRGHGFVRPESNGWFDPDVIISSTASFMVKYEYKTWNNIIFLKKPGGIYSQVWVNGKLVAYNTNNTYPGGSFDWIIDPDLGTGPNVRCGDLAYWHEDISDITQEIYNGGALSNWMNLSKKPKHYWRLGEPLNGGIVEDKGTDGSNYLTESITPTSFNYILASVNGANAGYKFGSGGSNTSGYANTTDSALQAKVGDSIVFMNNTGGHPLAIKDSNDFIVAEEDAGTKKTRWIPTHAGVYRYYCTTHPDTMGSTFRIYSGSEHYQDLTTLIQD